MTSARAMEWFRAVVALCVPLSLLNGCTEGAVIAALIAVFGLSSNLRELE